MKKHSQKSYLIIIFLFLSLICAKNSFAGAMGNLASHIFLGVEETVYKALYRQSVKNLAKCFNYEKDVLEDTKKRCEANSDENQQSACQESYVVNFKKINFNCQSYDFRLNQCIKLKVQEGSNEDSAKSSCISDGSIVVDERPLWLTIASIIIIIIATAAIYLAFSFLGEQLNKKSNHDPK